MPRANVLHSAMPVHSARFRAPVSPHTRLTPSNVSQIVDFATPPSHPCVAHPARGAPAAGVGAGKGPDLAIPLDTRPKACYSPPHDDHRDQDACQSSS